MEKADLRCVISSFSSARDSALSSISGYSSLDFKHIHDIQSVISSMSAYIEDDSLKRPRNFMLVSSPGSGKSHLVNCIAKTLGRNQTEVAPFNMATMQSIDDLANVVDAARNIIADRKLPIIFLDEFDSKDDNYSLLLPLLWDGELSTGSRQLRLGRAIFLLAGSRRELPSLVREARQCNTPPDAPQHSAPSKQADLLSRINGSVVQIPSLQNGTGMVGKVVLAIHLLRLRFHDCLQVPMALLWFIAHARFRYDVRSIATMIDLIPRVDDKGNPLVRDGILELTRDSLDFCDRDKLSDSALAFHLFHPGGTKALSELWAEAFATRGSYRQHIHFEGIEDIFTDQSGISTAQLLKLASQRVFTPEPCD